MPPQTTIQASGPKRSLGLNAAHAIGGIVGRALLDIGGPAFIDYRRACAASSFQRRVEELRNSGDTKKQIRAAYIGTQWRAFAHHFEQWLA